MTGSAHGGDRRAASRRTGIPEERIIDFSASISPAGVPGTVRQILHQHEKDLPHYPQPHAEELCAAVEKRYRLEKGSVICGNGSTELIYLIPRALRPKRVLLTSPTFSEYERACRLGGSRLVHHPLMREDDFRVSAGDMIRALQGKGGGKSDACSMAFLCNPNNPTGQLLSRKKVLEIAEAARKIRCYLVVDEAFIDFCPGHSVANEVRKNPWLIVLRSLTKFYALAGIRAGYAVLSPDLAEKVRQNKEPWTVNSLAQKAGIASLKDRSYEEKAQRVVAREKTFIERSLESAGIQFIPSQANYYLLRMKNARKVAAGLERKGILVRDCSNFRGLDGSWLRIAVRTRKENKILMQELPVAASGDTI
ncbi:MAG: threonine-phosphate decarboxylase CobD [Nitrospiraceae bacterium]|nr:threonine-phosphate decarboxylase CobD [Nitrospiraceae bacterium]